MRDVWISSKGLYSLTHTQNVCPCDGCLVLFLQVDLTLFFYVKTRQWTAGPSNTPGYWSFPTLFAWCLSSPIPPPDPCSVCTRPLWQGRVRKMNLSCVSTGSTHIPALLFSLFVHLTCLYVVWTLVMSGVLQSTLVFFNASFHKAGNQKTLISQRFSEKLFDCNKS